MAWEPGTPLRLADGAYSLTLVRTDLISSEINLQAILEAAQLLPRKSTWTTCWSRPWTGC